MRFNLNSNVGISINGSYRKSELPLTEMRVLDGEYQKYEGEKEVKLDLSGFKVGANVVLSF
ncbi:hypothetical protein PW5551_04435 [Petrotoga sp. 9PW.55.5.1]|nr:hypothetical protein PW5551_04435 [Petrotoga sp. 9PW.55.5.1]